MGEIECPVPCDRCGELVDLDRCHRHTPFCGCMKLKWCSHGICDDCLALVEIEEADARKKESEGK